MILKGRPACHVCSARKSAKLLPETFSPWSLMMSGCVFRSPGNDSHRARETSTPCYRHFLSRRWQNSQVMLHLSTLNAVFSFFLFFILQVNVRVPAEALFSESIYTDGKGSEVERIHQVSHMLILGQQLFSISAPFSQRSLISALLLWSPPHIISAEKRSFSTHS